MLVLLLAFMSSTGVVSCVVLSIAIAVTVSFDAVKLLPGDVAGTLVATRRSVFCLCVKISWFSFLALALMAGQILVLNYFVLLVTVSC